MDGSNENAHHQSAPSTHSEAPLAVIIGSTSDEEYLAPHLKRRGISQIKVSNFDSAWKTLDGVAPNLIVIDMDLATLDAKDLLSHPRLQTGVSIVLTSKAENPPRLNDLIQTGSVYFFSGLSQQNFILSLLDDIAADCARACELGFPSPTIAPVEHFSFLRGSSTSMHALYRAIRRVAASSAPLLISGESGTGKTLIARSIHQLSNHHFNDQVNKPFISLDCSAVADEELEAQLFGRVLANTHGGGPERIPGCIELAEGATLHLANITAMPRTLQAKFLQALESQEFTALGSNERYRVETRVIVETEAEPEKDMKRGLLRKDLYFYLSGFSLVAPPLRERDEDIYCLARYFLSQVKGRAQGRQWFSEDALNRLRSYSWPGNVRQLRGVVERASILANGCIDIEHLPDFTQSTLSRITDALSFQIGETLESAEQKLLMATLSHFDGDKRKAAKTLGVSLKTLYNRLNQYSRISGLRQHDGAGGVPFNDIEPIRRDDAESF